MHLLAAQPGGFVDDEGIIDLGQSPADLVILSAADGHLGSLAAAQDSLPQHFPSVRLANWLQLTKPAAFDLYCNKVIDHAKVVVVSLLGGKSYWPYGVEQLIDWQNSGADRQLILLPGDDNPDPDLLAYSSVDAETCNRLWRFSREGGVDNSRESLHFLAATFFGIDVQWREPCVLPSSVIYDPALKGQGSLRQWQSRWHSEWPVCLLLFYRSHLQSGNTDVFDELIVALQAQQLNTLPVAVTSLKDAQVQPMLNHLIDASDATLIVNSTGFASNTVASPELSSEPTDFANGFERPLPVLQLVLSSSTKDDWLQHAQGLRSRDIAMQVVLPEMDGRVLTRAVSFKSESYFSDRCEASVVRYALHAERANFVAQLAKRYCVLAEKNNTDKRIALVLANYPTKDGRIGNGVGLDTPASAVNILRALEQQGYPINDIPEDGDALICRLLEAVTNNPNTLHQLHCWQSLAVDDYLRFFSQLPKQCQRAVWDQWGAPEQDPKYRNGRLMVSGIRLGDTFVGIQPARGYNLDHAANYHSPDLIPPHSYLAFYCWLREIYQVDAVVHVGKHGNLEWLPGKGTALCDSCWPDIALGPMPNFYPFIVNDPGEGAQAKRRTQAVIIDHLMPPMTRAETYGDLAELEALVDEYYQALGMDTSREAWLREQILNAVKTTHVLEELAVDGEDDAAVLEQLDAYLCDIKEAQIRHGLHILGELPRRAKLADTLVALLRLPRGEGAENQGIIHNLVADFDLRIEGGLFEPQQAAASPWQGSRPELLQSVSEALWRTEADTRERLELLAAQWLSRYVIDAESFDALAADFPATARQFHYARKRLYKALHVSAEQEINALMQGLSGQFVAPGPSGAPTRGRLDTLPTGRNFFSVDNRSIPSPAAWALGQKSAQALLERHLQEHGDFPRSLGLSVWGTATMRTGGDDIAQAFALMGVKPVWAPGSQRVVDFEIVPAMLLARPRVDVTLRVSGFFRDAFPNVMKLFDAAVRAIAELDEPGESNSIRKHIEQEQQRLEAEGLTSKEASLQAGYRVFGSKPGAYGAGLQGLIDERCWEERSDLMQAYLNWGGYAYGQGRGDGVQAREAFAQRLSGLEIVIHNQDNREHDLLDSDDYYQFQGGMTNAVTTLKGEAPAVYHSDHANPERPVIRTLKEELNWVVRSRVLNPKWIEAMREHGYKGGFEMAASVDYLFAYDATTHLVADYQYQQVTDTLLMNRDNRDFLQKHNPKAMEEMAERLLEACQRGLWQEPGDYAEALQDLLLDIDQQQEESSE